MDTSRTTAIDCISGLPDDLLLSILARLRSTAQAARTSVLSRRWRHVWVNVPELCLDYEFKYSNSNTPVHDRVDAALAACSATTVTRLEIIMPYDESGAYLTRHHGHIPMDRVSRWLRFASQRLAGELWICLNGKCTEDELVLPPCERVTAMDLLLQEHTLRFQLPPTSSFSALVTLRITLASIDGTELEEVLSSRCPQLKKLILLWVHPKFGSQVLSIGSKSLEQLEVTVCFMQHTVLRVDAPELQVFTTRFLNDAYITVPKLSKVVWNSYHHDSSCQKFKEVARYLKRLEIKTNTDAVALMHQFDTVHELQLNIHIRLAIGKYKRFVEDINQIAKCNVLIVQLIGRSHALKPIILQVLSKCAGVRKLLVHLNTTEDNKPCNTPGCPCSVVESPEANNIMFDLLEEVEINGTGTDDRKLEIVRVLCGWLGAM